MYKYNSVIDEINKCIDDFNTFLNLEMYQFPHIILNNSLALKNSSDCHKNLPYFAQFGGVYFYFGFEKEDKAKLCLYIGKASNNQGIGSRLSVHLKDMYREIFEENLYYVKNSFCIEYVSALHIEEPEYVFLAPSLEEFIITNVKCHDLTLFNYVGVSKVIKSC